LFANSYRKRTGTYFYVYWGFHGCEELDCDTVCDDSVYSASSSTVKMEAVCYSYTLLPTYQAKPCHNMEDSISFEIFDSYCSNNHRTFILPF
jgi:hypothetical protein